MGYISTVFIATIVTVTIVGMYANGEKGEYEVVEGEAPMAKTEQEALYSAIQGFVGSWWNGTDLYPDPCGWTPIQGVSCDIYDELWYVTDLNIGSIHDNSLSCASKPEFRPDLFKLTHLKSLAFFDCFHEPPIVIPSENWTKFSGSLESLEFRSNPGLTGPIPAAFSKLHKLQSLVVIGNGFSGGLPENIGNWTHLKRLVLSENGFRGEIGDNYGYLSELLILDLSRNSLSGNIPLTFGGLTSLLKLDMSQNRLEGKIPDEVSSLKNLTLLDLSSNKISGGLTKSIQEMGSLKELILSRNPIGSDLMGIKWQNLKRLMVLDLSNTQLTGGIPESISKMKRLRFLGLNDNYLSGNLTPKLAKLHDLSSLYVYGNNLSGKLEFDRGFYGKMGRRFGAWNNSNLCLPINLLPTTSLSPFGVKACEEEVKSIEVSFGDSDSKLGSFHLGNETSFSFSRYKLDGIWSVFMVVIFFKLVM
ncbi:unnamed protein product [Lactuca saligna]|uniref:Leucine-rich repeat-containing N-terminal plant-type domain-containing protein n=1 Tax=Lactuca saligna TaxID=75948 RepID=A0AA35ZPZ3_LACSI|nr:unnamed protein product [Lactuca saligna]